MTDMLLSQAELKGNIMLTSLSASVFPETHPWVQISDFSSFSIFVGDLNMLVAAGVNHHVPRVAIQAIGPVVVTLDNNKILG